jgi:regulator of nucleoside diphosphate kinase
MAFRNSSFGFVMRTHTIIISSTDRDRLLDLIDSARFDWQIPRNSLDVLEGELARARIVDPLELPRDVIAIGSTVWFQDLDTQENERLQLVLPPDSDVTCRRTSVLSPMGTALLGFRRGDSVEWQLPHGRRRLAILKVAQHAPSEAEPTHVNSINNSLAKGLSRECHLSSPPAAGVSPDRDRGRSPASRPTVAI